jgi:RNA polymerase sigma factor (sigma-70 family)
MSHKLGTDNREREQRFDEDFWMECYPKLQRYCHFLAQNSWDGDDIAQETYLKALKYTPQQQKISSALLNKMAYHHWIDLLRKRKNESIEAEPAASEVINQLLDDLTASVELLLKQFTPKQAVIFLLKEAFQYQAKEIADIFETTEMAVKSILHRAKKRIGKDNEADVFWNEEERELLFGLFYEALKNQDPTSLIQLIPTLKSVFEIPKLTIKAQIPSSTLCMAA